MRGHVLGFAPGTGSQFRAAATRQRDRQLHQGWLQRIGVKIGDRR